MYSAGDYNAWLSAQERSPEQADPIAGNGAAGVCQCGTFAIGICQTCGSPMCGRDTCGAFTGTLTCAQCLATVAELRRQEEVEAAKKAFQQREEHRRFLESLAPCTPEDLADFVVNRRSVQDGTLNGRRFLGSLPWSTIAEYLLEGGVPTKHYTRSGTVYRRNWYGRNRPRTVVERQTGWAVLSYKVKSSGRFGVTNESAHIGVLRTDGTFEESARQAAGAEGNWDSIGNVIRDVHLPHRTSDPFPVKHLRSYD